MAARDLKFNSFNCNGEKDTRDTDTSFTFETLFGEYLAVSLGILLVYKQ